MVRAYQERLNVVHFDAHLDYRPFIHGVQWANGNPIRNVAKLKTVPPHHPGRDPEPPDAPGGRGGLAGARQRHRDRSPSSAAAGPESIVDRLPRNEPVYVSIDIDVLDLPLVPGCASSEVNGLTYDELRQTLFAIAKGREVIGFDLVEVNPMLDVASDNTSLLAAQLIIEFLGRIVEHPGYRKRHPKKAGRKARVGASREGRSSRRHARA